MGLGVLLSMTPVFLGSRPVHVAKNEEVRLTHSFPFPRAEKSDHHWYREGTQKMKLIRGRGLLIIWQKQGQPNRKYLGEAPEMNF